MQTAMAEDETTKQQLQEKLKDESWFDVATFAAYHCQMRSLGLPPWRQPPCWADEDDKFPADQDAQRLLRKMLAAGISRYHPNPMAALAKR